ncbi:hypothetical protein MtrunA17_Chr8g0381651 [Medicago truncatula]|uniref:Uncharacterized protein n=1 Tax=Medicago truncatula TaxID=3880 RepID=A0A396GQS2_MEDTR|nr:hypothetical protein MtrunA17_Chr8g0381651 [Medicago truncatula]
MYKSDMNRESYQYHVKNTMIRRRFHKTEFFLLCASTVVKELRLPLSLRHE